MDKALDAGTVPETQDVSLSIVDTWYGSTILIAAVDYEMRCNNLGPNFTTNRIGRNT
jgi:hypothetical protein